MQAVLCTDLSGQVSTAGTSLWERANVSVFRCTGRARINRMSHSPVAKLLTPSSPPEPHPCVHKYSLPTAQCGKEPLGRSDSSQTYPTSSLGLRASRSHPWQDFPFLSTSIYLPIKMVNPATVLGRGCRDQMPTVKVLLGMYSCRASPWGHKSTITFNCCRKTGQPGSVAHRRRVLGHGAERVLGDGSTG